MRRSGCGVRGWTRGATTLIGVLVLLVAAPRGLAAQERGAIALGEAVEGLGVTARVLVIGAHPDDEDTFLITWLQRGRHVETAYLSLTRGDGGQNLIGNELGEALGVIRTEELLAARRIDGARQYFTRAFDFGFSKDTIDTYKHWQRDSILGDVVRVVRTFRPHVIVAVFSGTTRDGHGHHQVSGLLARDAYDAAADTIRFRPSTFGPSWTPLKFYRAARFNQTAGTIGFDVGEYSPLLGRSFGEIAGESRSQHKSQGFGALQRKGPIMAYLRREATRVNDGTEASAERTMFDGIDTSWARFRGTVTDARVRSALDSLPTAFSVVRGAFDAFSPGKVIRPLARASSLIGRICPTIATGNCFSPRESGRTELESDLFSSSRSAQGRVGEAMKLASGIAIEATVSRELAAVGGMVPIAVTVYNRGRDTVRISNGGVLASRGSNTGSRVLHPGGVLRDTLLAKMDSLSQPWWLTGGRVGGMFVLSASDFPENQRPPMSAVYYVADLGLDASGPIEFEVPVAFRVADEIKGEIQRPISGAPAISVTLDQRTQYAVANATVDREVSVHLRSATAGAREVRVSLALPKGLSADSVTRTTRLDPKDADVTIAFRVRGRLAPGEHRIDARAESNGETFASGYDLIDYDHIRRRRVYRPASIRVSAVDVRVPSTLRVAYITGVGDNVAPTLTQLGIPVTVLAASEVARAELQSFTTVVIGPRAYEAHPELRTANPHLFNFARKGGTLVVQYGQNEMVQPGMMPYPITLGRPADRVTQEDAPVTIDAADTRELLRPNRIGQADFAGWVQERSLYMPRTFDERYRSLLSISDSGEPSNRGAVLIAPLGDGLYVYTSLAFFRQLPAGVPGAARLFVNLLSAGLAPARMTP